MVPREAASQQVLFHRVSIHETRTPMYRTIALVAAAGRFLEPASQALESEFVRYRYTVEQDGRANERAEAGGTSYDGVMRAGRKGGDVAEP